MAESKYITSFARGLNNLDQAIALPDGAVRELMNFDPVGGGSLSLRSGYQKLQAITGVRGGFEVGADIIVVADDIYRFSPRQGYATLLAAAPEGTKVLGTELNNDGFMQVGVTQLRVRGSLVAPWAVPDITPDIGFVAGALPAGTYRVAVTCLDAFGAESGATPMIFTLNGAEAVTINWTKPAGAVSCRVYASVANGETLYSQGEAENSFTLNAVRDDLARLTTMNLQPPPLADHLAVYKARVILAADNVLWFASPFAPHLVNYIDGHVSYDAPIVMVQPVDDGVYLATEHRTYWLTDPTLDQAKQEVIAEHGAIPGSNALLPDGRATWLCEYGQVFGSKTGALELPQRESYAPTIASTATAGVVSHNGVQMVVTNLKGAVTPNALSVVDSFDLEIE